jgi:hypothetical protein
MENPLSRQNQEPLTDNEIMLLKSAIYDYKGDDDQLLSQYNNEQSIIDRLCDASTDVEKYEFLGDLFFELVLVHTNEDSPLANRLELLRNTHFEIMQFYELARAAKLLKAQQKSDGN